MRRVFVSIALVFAFGFAASMSRAQNITASLTGTVTDSSGGVVPNATVIVHNDATGQNVRTVTTDSRGVFTATLIPIGTYTVTIKKTGFKNFTANQVTLHVGEHRALDAVLQPGAVTQHVTVTATATPVKTTTAAQEQTITGTQIRELQLNNRNFEQLVTLEPGVASNLPDQISFGITNTDAISVNGARTGANNWTVDGADVNDSGSNLTLLNVPSVDALSEFTLARSTYDAQYGRSGGGQVNVVTKSGTSQFHGDVYEFDRNDVLNANSFLNNAAGVKKPPYRYNDFGYTIGGPIYIPGVYNTSRTKSFFFWSQEFRRNTIPYGYNATLPSAAELQGTIAGQVPVAPSGCVTYDAASNTSQISPSCFSQNAKAYIANVYSKFSSNVPGTTQFISSPTGLNNYRQEIIRVDQVLSNKTQAFARYMEDNVPTSEPGGLFAGEPLPGISSTSTNAPGRNLVLHLTKEFSPTVVNEVAFNYSWGAINSNVTGDITNPSFVGAITTGNFPYSDPYHRVPGLSISGYTGVAIPVSPYKERNIDKEAYDNLSIVRGNHSIRTGVSFQWMRKSENAVNPTNGSFSFNTVNGDPAFANFLLGQAYSFSQASRDIIPDLHFLNFAAYVQDDWKIRPNLTLNLGVRYSYLPTPYDVKDILDNFDPATFNPNAVPTIDPTTGLFAAQQTLTAAGQPLMPANYVNGIIVGTVNSPYGKQVNPSYDNAIAPRIGFAWDPFNTGKTSIRGGYGIYYDRTLNGIWEQNQFENPPFVSSIYIPNPSFDNPSATAASVSLSPRRLHATGTPAFKVPSYQQWSFSVEREVIPNTTVQVAYVGSKGTHLLGAYDANQVPVDVRMANLGDSYNALRPYPGYSAITAIAPMFDSNYNSLQVSVNRRVSRGLNLGVAYTWSKTLANNSTDRSSASLDTYNRALDYGAASYSIPQVLIFNYIYDLPFYRSQSGFVGHVLGGWETSGITTIESGFPLTFFQYNDPFDVYGGIGIDPSAVSPRPDYVSGQSLSGPKTPQEWFNTAAFTDAVGHFGTAGRGILTGPGFNNWDFALFKNTRISERFTTQFRAEFFNVFNHTSFSSVGTNVDSSTFGRVLGTHDPRIIQLGLKVMF
ncbi:MAG: carboxypeptidase regulatory-like domain-containing protein [Acidobacteriota bacterium]